MMDVEKLVEILVQARKDAGMTQLDVAKKMKCHVTFVQRIEANHGDRQVSAFGRYADAVGIRITFGRVSV